MSKDGLTNKHLQIIREGIIMLECDSCSLVKECQRSDNTFCSDIGNWLRKQEEGNN